jgi:hypothetical protein
MLGVLGSIIKIWESIKGEDTATEVVRVLETAAKAAEKVRQCSSKGMLVF